MFVILYYEFAYDRSVIQIRFSMLKCNVLSQTPEYSVLLNWQEELKLSLIVKRRNIQQSSSNRE